MLSKQLQFQLKVNKTRLGSYGALFVHIANSSFPISDLCLVVVNKESFGLLKAIDFLVNLVLLSPFVLVLCYQVFELFDLLIDSLLAEVRDTRPLLLDIFGSRRYLGRSRKNEYNVIICYKRFLHDKNVHKGRK